MNRVALLAVFALFAAACSGGDAAVVETTATLPTAPPTTTAPTPATTAVSTTVARASTTEATTSTSAPVTDEVALVAEAIDLAQSTFSACLVAMPACDPSSLAAARAGDLLVRNSARIEEWNALGYTVRDRELFRYVVETVVVDASGLTATATVCIADGSRLVQPNSAPDGSDVIVDDEFVSGRSAWDMRLDADGVWRGHDTSPVGAPSSEDVCPAG